MKYGSAEFYVKAFNVATNGCDVGFVPPIIRRRLSIYDRACICTMNAVFSPDIKNIVFASRLGEVDRLNKMIKEYTEEKEVSQNTFSCSVHNYPAGFFLLNKKVPLTYTALSAGKNTIVSGLLSAVVSPYNNVLYCFGDMFGEKACSFSVNIIKNTDCEGQKYMLVCENNENSDCTFEDFVKLFNGESEILKTSLYTLKRADGD